MASMPNEYSSFPFGAEGFTKTIYTRGTGPGVLVMHELPGMVPQCVKLADRIAGAGFAVFLPLLFGEPNVRTSAFRTAGYMAQLCIRREIFLFASDRNSPLTRYLRALVREIRRRCPEGRGVGVVGMCLTGGFTLNLMVEDVVRAPVMSQPALPLAVVKSQKDALGVSTDTLRRAVGRAAETRLLCFRFLEDSISPKQRFERLARTFGDAFEGHQLPGDKHSVLTVHLVEEAGHPTFQARERVLRFLDEQLKS